MNENHNSKLKPNAQNLRKNMTKEEKHLWYDFLKNLPTNVYRQKVIGNYIVDFYIAKPPIVIEIDGSQHGKPENRLKDEQRDRFLSEQGIKVLRYTNVDVNCNFEGVCRDLLRKMGLI